MARTPKILRIGTTQNMLLVLTGFLALGFIDPINSIDKKRILEILLTFITVANVVIQISGRKFQQVSILQILVKKS